LVSYEKLVKWSTEFPGIRVDDQKWYSSLLLNVKV